MSLKRWGFSVIWIIALLHMPSAFAMQSDRFPTPSDYSIKMAERDGRFSYHEVPAAVGVCPLALHVFNRIKDWQRPPDQTDEPTSIQFKFRRVDDAIKVDLSLIFGPVEKSRTLPRNGLPAESISSHSLRLGESALLQELARFGIEPFEIKVVSANSRTLDPSRVINRTKSVEVVRINKARRHYFVVYKNISSKNILAMRIVYPVGESPLGSFSQSHLKPLMAPGEIYETEFQLLSPGPMAQQVAGPGKRKPGRLTVAGVVYDDLTYEGEKEDAIEVAAGIRAKQIQWPRIIGLLKDAVAAYAQDKQRALDKLKKDVAALSIEPESSDITNLAKRFSPITERELGRLIYYLKEQMSEGRRRLLLRIEYGEKLERTNSGDREHSLPEIKNDFEEGLQKLLRFGFLR